MIAHRRRAGATVAAVMGLTLIGGVICPRSSVAQTFAVPANLGDSAVMERTMPALAAEVARHSPGSADLQYRIWARAKVVAAQNNRPFDSAFAGAFREVFATLDDHAAALAIRALSVSPRAQSGSLALAVQRLNGRTSITLDEAVRLARAWQRTQTSAEVAPLLASSINEDDARRYIIDRDVRVRTPDGATVCALIVRPRTMRPLPALLTFTIYVDSAAVFSEARRGASNAYASVVGFTRGKACSPDAPIPYRYDGTDAATLIDWISAQRWSDGRVGMYGGSYSGFSTWAVAKHMPKALKAIMVGAPVAPGVDVPSEGNIVWNYIYPWPFYTTNNNTLDNATYFDNARWSKLNREWYASGRAYEDLDKIDGAPNPFFYEWLSHPSYDAYWRGIIPNANEFAKLQIPVLQTAGYYFGGPGAAVFYFTQHYASNPNANHYLLIGPYDHPQAQRGVIDALGDTTTNIAGYETDPVARIDITAGLRYQWFDWVLKGGPRPALLRDRVNYEVMDDNVWKHASSIAAMSNSTVRLFLSPTRAAGAYQLSRSRTLPDSAATLRLDLAYRGDIDTIIPGGGVRDTAINTYLALEYVSDPVDQPMEVSGLFSGHLELAINKRDFDLSVQLFELTSKGEYFQLAPFQMRASYARDLSVRHLLTPGARESLDFKAIRLISRKLSRGSRIVAVIGPIKWPGQQINYGSGKDVSKESIADAGEPMQIRLFGASYLDIPVWRGK